MPNFITARQAAALTGRSKSQINRDAAVGKLPAAVTVPGYNGPRLFNYDDVVEYAEQLEAAS